MAKKKKLLMCHCTTKKVFGKRKNFGGTNCICDPYPNGMKKGMEFEEVFISKA